MVFLSVYQGGDVVMVFLPVYPGVEGMLSWCFCLFILE